jgi:hypothetical protein
MGVYTTTGNNQQKILRSTDDGANWAVSYNGGGFHIHDVFADPFQASAVIYATCDPGLVGGERWRVIRSTDNGATWTDRILDASYIKINSLSGMRLFGADDVNGSIVKTTDDTNITTLYQSGTAIVSFSAVRVGTRVYFGQVVSSGTSYPQIVSTDGTTCRVEWRGNSITA